MAKKRTGLSQTLFQGIDPYAQSEAGELDGDRVWQLPLTAVAPDPQQPRQFLPTPLVTAVFTGQSTPTEALQTWLQTATPPEQQKLADLRQLAYSIAHHGLINPITVRPPHPDENLPARITHLIVTGERRYWAHVLLSLEDQQIQAGDTAVSPTQIRAILSASGITIRAHQLIENIVREDINALEKAQGIWALRYELSGVNYRSPSDRSPSEGDLVAWSQVETALGISKRYRIYLIAVLNLCPEAQAIVEQNSLAEMAIRPITQKLKDFPELQIEALNQLLAWQRENAEEDSPRQAITKSMQDLVNRLLKRQMRAENGRPEPVTLSPQTDQFSQRVQSTMSFLKKLEQQDIALVARDLALDSAYQQTVADLQDLQQQLETLLAKVAEYQAEGK